MTAVSTEGTATSEWSYHKRFENRFGVPLDGQRNINLTMNEMSFKLEGGLTELTYRKILCPLTKLLHCFVDLLLVMLNIDCFLPQHRVPYVMHVMRLGYQESVENVSLDLESLDSMGELRHLTKASILIRDSESSVFVTARSIMWSRRTRSSNNLSELSFMSLTSCVDQRLNK